MIKAQKLMGLMAAGFGVLSMASVAVAGDSNGNFQVKAGVSFVDTDDKTKFLQVPALGGAANLADVGHGATTENMWLPTLTLTYYLTKNIGVELFCCFGGTSVKAHGATSTLLGGDTELAHTTMFPPALTIAYHFDQLGPIRPYVGVGAQWIHFFNEKVGDNGLGAVGAASVDIKDGFGFVLQGGVDYDLGNGLSLGFDVKKTWLDTEISWKNAAGAEVARAKHDLDPLIFTANLGYRFNLSDLFGSRSAPAPLK